MPRPTRPTRSHSLQAAAFVGLLAASALAQGTAQEAGVPDRTSPPKAKVVPTRLETHGHERIDDYYWLRERDNPEVIDYLEQENEYMRSSLAHTAALQESLFEEMVGRVRQDDATVPYRSGNYWYYTRYEEGQQYPIHCRKQESLEADEEVLFDVNAMAEGHGYYSVGTRAVSPDHRKIAFAVDTRGRRIYTIQVKDLESGEISDQIADVTSNVVWAEDGKTLFYARRDLETLRTFQIWRHELGTSPESDVLVFEEADEEFSCFVTKTLSRQYLVIGSSQTLATEYRVLDANEPTGDFRVIVPRKRNHEYHIDHHGEFFYVVTNWDAPNFRLMWTPVRKTARKNWEEVIPHRKDVLLQGVTLFRGHIVVNERADGLVQLRYGPYAALQPEGARAKLEAIEFGEPAYSARPMSNYEFDSQILRYGYSSLTTPNSVFDFDMNSKEAALMKRDEVFGGFDPENYRTERLYAKAADGTAVPISIVYRKPFKRDGKRPLLLYGYGSYGSSMDARFSPNALSLLDRGFTYAIAHIRGGQEMGRQWYEDGKLLKKRNTFTDFIACADHLIAEGYTASEHLYGMGGSAGGLLIGAVINMRPGLFRGVVARVPFVDVVTTMLDESIPLTTFEYDEWGNPNDKSYYEYMLSYSPYDQVEAKEYPNMLVTTGLHDSQVQYWEPAKWVAKLRAVKTGAQKLLLKTDMEAGHGGVSGRYSRYRDQALIYAFLLDLEDREGVQ